MADPPLPFWRAHVAVQHHKVYVTGLSQVKDTEHQVYVYDGNTDEWDQLPPSGHYYGIPQIIGSKLAIIGGHLSLIMKEPIKFPLLMKTTELGNFIILTYSKSEVDRGCMVTHLEHVIVAGGSRGTVRNRVTQDVTHNHTHTYIHFTNKSNYKQPGTRRFKK